jgi:hypothetical protein
MSHAKVIGRLGMLAVGLGIGAAVAGAPGIASADSTGVDAGVFDPSALIADAASSFSGLNLAISIDGYPVLESGTASATSGTDDIAIAYGNDSIAIAGDTASPGTFDSAFADGDYSYANSGIGNDDSATAIGSSSEALAGAGNGDSAYADGSNTTATAGGEFTSGNPNILDVAANDSYASAIGDDDYAAAGSAVDGSASTTAVTGDIATIIGNSSDAYAGAGDYDFAGVLGDSLTASAFDGSNLFDFMPSL